MKELLTEVFNIKNGLYVKKDGSKVPIAYIDPQDSENTYQYKDEIKKYGAVWLQGLKTWGWFTNNNPQVYQDKIKPCLEYLVSVEKTEDGEKRDVIAIIDKLLSEIDDGNVADAPNFNVEGIKGKLEQFKKELVSIMSDEELKAKLLPIVKFRNAQGHQYSFMNAILVLVQDPEATLVKSRTNWDKMNRRVKDGSPAIALYVPYGGTAKSPAQKSAITHMFLMQVGKSNIDELTPGEKEELRVRLRPRGNKFKLVPSFYDVRFTEQIEGKEDLVGDNRDIDLPWHEDTSQEATEETEMYCKAVMESIQDRHIKLEFVDELGGALGVSTSGAIKVLKNQPLNVAMFNTLTHEYAHELLHQRYVVSNDSNPNGYGRFFVGKANRGVVEQQAEICAWIVLRNFGYDVETSINYSGLWGMDEKSAPLVFDTVASVATQMIKDISEKTRGKNMNESKENVMVNEMTGLDVARMLGYEDVYLKNKEENELDDKKRYEFKESFDKILGSINDARSRTLKSEFRL